MRGSTHSLQEAPLDLLAALGACIDGGWTTFGAAIGIPVESVHVELTCELDLQGFIGLPAPGVLRPGKKRIHAAIRVKSRAPCEQLEKLAEVAEGASPVKDSLRAAQYARELIVKVVMRSILASTGSTRRGRSRERDGSRGL